MAKPCISGCRSGSGGLFGQAAKAYVRANVRLILKWVCDLHFVIFCTTKAAVDKRADVLRILAYLAGTEGVSTFLKFVLFYSCKAVVLAAVQVRLYLLEIYSVGAPSTIRIRLDVRFDVTVLSFTVTLTERGMKNRSWKNTQAVLESQTFSFVRALWHWPEALRPCLNLFFLWTFTS